MKRVQASLAWVLALLLIGAVFGYAQRGALSLFAPTEWRWQLATLLLGLGLCWAVWRERQGPLPTARWVGWLLAVLLCTWIWSLCVLEWYQREWWWRLCIPVGSSAALALWLCLRTQRTWQLLRNGVLLLLVTALLLECGLRALHAWRPTQLTARESSESGASLERNRPRPGTLRFRVPCNSGGHYDEEFAPRTAGTQRVAVIGDSFSQGTVPLRWHYTSVAERRLGYPVDNYGVSGIGLPEYEQILREEVLPRDPSAVVISLFVGNDLEWTPTAPTAVGEADWLDAERVLLVQVPKRLQRMAAERRANAGRVAAVVGEELQATGLDVQLYPWLEDPQAELPTISLEGFLRLEEERARSLSRFSTKAAQALAQRLLRMKSMCGSRRFVVCLIPDEFQVEERLWEALQARVVDQSLERDRGQLLLGRELRELGVECVDLLPRFREVVPGPDGRRRLYHLQDTHWNARGNELAGQVLAEHLGR